MRHHSRSTLPTVNCGSHYVTPKMSTTSPPAHLVNHLLLSHLDPLITQGTAYKGKVVDKGTGPTRTAGYRDNIVRPA